MIIGEEGTVVIPHVDAPKRKPDAHPDDHPGWDERYERRDQPTPMPSGQGGARWQRIPHDWTE